MIIHRRIPRRLALVLGFVWLYASLVVLTVAIGPFLLGLLELVGTVEDLDGVVGVFGNVVEAYQEIVDIEWSDDLWLVLALLGGWGLLQIVFLSPLIGPPRTDGEGRPMTPSVVAATIVATTGSALAWLAILEGSYTLIMPGDSDDWARTYESIIPIGLVSALAIWTIGGFLWYRGLRRAGARYDPTGLDRLLRRVLAGTAIEAALGTMAILVVRRRSDCICATGSFFSLTYSLLVLVWLCGPWTILFATRRERSKWSRRACGRCGYVRRSGSKRCSECGAEWPEALVDDDELTTESEA